MSSIYFCRILAPAMAILLLIPMAIESTQAIGGINDIRQATETGQQQTESETSSSQVNDDRQESTSEELAAAKVVWAAHREQMASKAAEFKLAQDPAKQAELRKEYLDMLDQAKEMVVDIKHAAEKLFAEDPTNEDAIQTMIGTMMNDAANGRDAEVLRVGDVLIDGGAPVSFFEKAAKANRLTIDSKEIFEELMIRHQEAAADDLPRVKIVLPAGEVVVELFENEAPNTVANFISLVESEYYNGLKMHRVMENFMAQGGCPKGDGSSGPGYTIACECHTPEYRRHFSGSLSMAKKPMRDTGGSQFFLTFRRTKMLDGKHTVFGRVIKGQEVLDRITRTYDPQTNQPFPGVEPDLIQSASVIRKRDHEYKPVKVDDPGASPSSQENDNSNDGRP